MQQVGSLISKLQKMGQNRYGRYGAVLFLVGVIVWAKVAYQPTPAPLVPENETLVEKFVKGPVYERSLPTRLQIPKLKIDVPFEAPLGLLDSGEIAVPKSYDQVGWYEYGPTPGELGPAVVLGHVDSYLGAAVFYALGQLNEGDEILITREDGETVTFVVTELERPKQSAFPTARVYGNLDHAGLRLVTCSGIYERGKQRYTNNLIVYAKAVTSEVGE